MTTKAQMPKTKKTVFKFTKTELEGFKCPVGKGKIRLRDTEVRGLTLLITANGSRTYYVRRKIDGRAEEIKVGPEKDLTVDQARKLAAKKLLQLHDGQDLRKQRREKREGATLEDLWLTYRTAIVKGDRTMQEDAGVWRRYLEPWANKWLKDITEESAQRLYNRIAAGDMGRETKDKFNHTRPIKGGQTAARHTIKLLGAMFSACSKTFGMPGVNPAKGVKKSKEIPCDRFLTAEEFPGFWSALAEQDALIQDTMKLALYTAQRRTTLLTMRWDEINLNFKVWSIPKEKMKSSKAHIVPLTTQAVAILEGRREAAEEGAVWVLASPDSSTGHLLNPEKAIERIWKAAQIPAFSLHDLRRTFATWANSLGTPESIIAAILAHQYRNVTGIYAKATGESMRKAMQATADAMEKSVGLKKPKMATTTTTTVPAAG